MTTTLIFCLVGIFLPGFSAACLLGIQILLSKLGVECSLAWIIIFILTLIVALILPILFYRHLTVLTIPKLQNIKTRLTFFNAMEYTCIQACFAPIFTNGKTLCYVTDGQNGIELIFTAWLALPFLLIFSFFFNMKLKRNLFIAYSKEQQEKHNC